MGSADSLECIFQGFLGLLVFIGEVLRMSVDLLKADLESFKWESFSLSRKLFIAIVMSFIWLVLFFMRFMSSRFLLR